MGETSSEGIDSTGQLSRSGGFISRTRLLDPTPLRAVLNNWEITPEDTAVDMSYIPVTLPTGIDSPSPVDQVFTRAEGLSLSVLGQRFSYDVFTSLEALAGGSTRRHFTGNESVNRAIMEIIEKQSVEKFTIDMKIAESIRRIHTSAHNKRDSREALTVLLNVARAGGKIAVVLAHGGVPVGTETGKKELRIIGDGASLDVNDVVRDIAGRKNEDGSPKYSLVYFNACNEGNQSIAMGTKEKPVPIPVIAHKDINESSFTGSTEAKVHWPPGSEPDWKERVARALRR